MYIRQLGNKKSFLHQFLFLLYLTLFGLSLGSAEALAIDSSAVNPGVPSSGGGGNALLKTLHPQPQPACVTQLTEYFIHDITYSNTQFCDNFRINPFINTHQSTSEFCNFPHPPYALHNLNTPAKGGLLCPGKYTATVSCPVDTQGGCGGNSCGWDVGVYIYDAQGNVLSYPNSNPPLYGFADSSSTGGGIGHSGCVTTHNNICPNVGGTVMFTNRSVTIDTNRMNSLRIHAWVESGGTFYHPCALSVKQIQAY